MSGLLFLWPEEIEGNRRLVSLSRKFEEQEETRGGFRGISNRISEISNSVNSS